MPKSKIQSEQEVIRWFEEGRTYEWMQSEYRRKYGIETGLSMWSNFRSRRGLDRRINRDDDLIPWAVHQEHRQQYPVSMLRVEARHRAGMPLDADQTKRLVSWRRMLADKHVVVHYDPEKGFSYVPRVESDWDIIRRPQRKTTTRRRAEHA
ncbi:hypothetical protein ACWDA7_17085 [Streptomyces sp. NPDC001156]